MGFCVFNNVAVAAAHALEAHGLAAVQVEARVTPQRLHELLALSEVEGDRYDVLHFIGHGGFDSHADDGVLVGVVAIVGVDPLVAGLRQQPRQFGGLVGGDAARDAEQTLQAFLQRHGCRSVNVQRLPEGGAGAPVSLREKSTFLVPR